MAGELLQLVAVVLYSVRFTFTLQCRGLVNCRRSRSDDLVTTPTRAELQQLGCMHRHTHTHRPDDSTWTTECSWQLYFLSLLRPRKGVEYCDGCVCLSVCSHVSGTTRHNFIKYGRDSVLYIVVVICCVLPVFWMMTFCHIIGLMAT